MFAVEVRPAAAQQVRALMQGQKPEIAVRVYAQPGGGGGGSCGGCSGCGTGGGCGSGSVESAASTIQFGMAFAKARPDDTVLTVGGLRLIVDPSSMAFVNGAVIDYVEDLHESGFKITNPTLAGPEAGAHSSGDASSGSTDGCGCESNTSGGSASGCGCG